MVVRIRACSAPSVPMVMVDESIPHSIATDRGTIIRPVPSEQVPLSIARASHQVGVRQYQPMLLDRIRKPDRQLIGAFWYVAFGEMVIGGETVAAHRPTELALSQCACAPVIFVVLLIFAVRTVAGYRFMLTRGR